MGVYGLLRTLFAVQAFLGILTALWGAFFVAVTATDAPHASEADAWGIGIGLFFLLAITFAGVPASALQELNDFPRTKKLRYAYLSVFLMLFIFAPAALLEGYLLYRFKNIPDTSPLSPASSNRPTPLNPASDTPIDWDAYVNQRLDELQKDTTQP